MRETVINITEPQGNYYKETVNIPLDIPLLHAPDLLLIIQIIKCK